MTRDSIYPEFFKTGIGRLQKHGAQNGDFLGLFSALEHFRRDITDRHDVESILEVAELYVLGLDLFETVGFFLVNPASFDFELAHCAPESQVGLCAGIRAPRDARRPVRLGPAAMHARPFFSAKVQPARCGASCTR